MEGHEQIAQPPLYLRLKKKMSGIHRKCGRHKLLKFSLQSDRHSLLASPLRCDPSRSLKKVIAIVF